VVEARRSLSVRFASDPASWVTPVGAHAMPESR